MLTDKFKAMGLDAEIPSAVPREEVWWGHCHGWGTSYNGYYKTNAGCYFHLHP